LKRPRRRHVGDRHVPLCRSPSAAPLKPLPAEGARLRRLHPSADHRRQPH